MFKPTVVFSNNNRTVTVVGVNNNVVTRTAAENLNVAYRKDGGITIWADGEHKSQTIRLDAFGRTTTLKHPVI